MAKLDFNHSPQNHKSIPSCAACGTWAVKNANYCFHCGVALSSTFASDAPTIPLEPTTTKGRLGGFWNSLSGQYTTGLTLILGGSMFLAWVNGYEPGHGALLGVSLATCAGLSLVVIRWRLERRPTVEQPAAPQKISVTIHEAQLGRTSWNTTLGELDERITTEDLRAAALAKNFSRENLCREGLSQAKARLIQQEFLRLNLAVALPAGKNGYALTLRGKKVLSSLAPKGD